MRVESADQSPLLVLGLVAARDGALHNVSVSHWESPCWYPP